MTIQAPFKQSQCGLRDQILTVIWSRESCNAPSKFVTVDLGCSTLHFLVLVALSDCLPGFDLQVNQQSIDSSTFAPQLRNIIHSNSIWSPFSKCTFSVKIWQVRERLNWTRCWSGAPIFWFAAEFNGEVLGKISYAQALLVSRMTIIFASCLKTEDRMLSTFLLEWTKIPITILSMPPFMYQVANPRRCVSDHHSV